MRISLLVVVAVGSVSVARADPAADARQAFTAFVTSVATTPATAGVALFVSPFRSDDPVPRDLAPVTKLLDKPKVKISHVAVSRAGKSAWLVGEVTARVPRNGKRTSEALRVSALLGLGAEGWRVQATQWSATVANARHDGCGDIPSAWHLASDVPKDLVAPAEAVIAAYRAMPPISDSPFGDGDRSKLISLISDDRGGVVIGSAAGERFVGGKAIKALFKKWNVTDATTPDTYQGIPSRAGIGPDGELMWLALATKSYAQCTEYRSFLVLAKEASGWKIVHQHYADAISLP